MTETLTPQKTFWPLDKRFQPVEQTEDQRRITFFGAVRVEAGKQGSNPGIPVVYGGEDVNLG